MEMAPTPELHQLAASATRFAPAIDGVCRLSLEQARDPEFIAAWQALANNAIEPNPFFEPWFLLPSLTHIAPENGGSEIELLAHFFCGSLTGLMPLVRSSRYYGKPVPHLATWLHSNAFYGAPLIAEGAERLFWESFLSFCDRSAKFSAFAHLPMLEEDGRADRALCDHLSESGRHHKIVSRNERAMLASDLSPKDYLTRAMSKKHRKELQRKLRRLGELGKLAFECTNECSGLDQWIAEFLALEAAGWKGAAHSALASAEGSKRFFDEAICEAAQAGKLERVTLRLDGKPIAMLASLVCAPGKFGFKTAFDENYATYSPGMQLQIHNLSALEDRDIQWTDSCAAQDHPMIDRLWTERRPLVARNIAIGNVARQTLGRALMAYETRKQAA